MSTKTLKLVKDILSIFLQSLILYGLDFVALYKSNEKAYTIIPLILMPSILISYLLLKYIKKVQIDTIIFLIYVITLILLPLRIDTKIVQILFLVAIFLLFIENRFNKKMQDSINSPSIVFILLFLGIQFYPVETIRHISFYLGIFYLILSTALIYIKNLMFYIYENSDTENLPLNHITNIVKFILQICAVAFLIVCLTTNLFGTDNIIYNFFNLISGGIFNNSKVIRTHSSLVVLKTGGFIILMIFLYIINIFRKSVNAINEGEDNSKKKLKPRKVLKGIIIIIISSVCIFCIGRFIDMSMDINLGVNQMNRMENNIKDKDYIVEHQNLPFISTPISDTKGFNRYSLVITIILVIVMIIFVRKLYLGLKNNYDKGINENDKIENLKQEKKKIYDDKLKLNIFKIPDSNNEKIRLIYYKKIIKLNKRDSNKYDKLTPTEISKLASDGENLEVLTRLYQKARYSDKECSDDDVQNGKK